MPTFRYRAYGQDGSLAEGTIDATSADAASDLLCLQGITPFQLRAGGGVNRWWNREIAFGDRSSDLLAFTREFSTLMAAGIPLDDALRIVREQAATQRLRELLDGLLAEALGGAALSDAMEKQAKVFPADYIAVVRAGEIGGTLADVLVELAGLLERRAEVRSRIQSALVYPASLVVLTLATLAIILGALVPSIMPIFAQSGQPVPASIRSLMVLQEHWGELLLAGGVCVSVMLSFLSLATRNPGVGQKLDRAKLRVPVLGTFLMQHEAARFARTLGTLLKAGVPLSHATRSARDVIGNRHIGAGMDRVLEAVHQGTALHRALRDEAVLPPVALQMISVGEEAGKLTAMLMRVATLLERQVQSGIDRFMSMLTPALTVVIALVVGALIMPVMSAVLSINDVATR
jgi:general secretion pathway protein F